MCSDVVFIDGEGEEKIRSCNEISQELRTAHHMQDSPSEREKKNAEDLVEFSPRMGERGSVLVRGLLRIVRGRF